MFPRRWVACFDILGFESLLNKASRYSDPNIILRVCDQAIYKARWECKTPEAKIGVLHFSDTFVFYSLDDQGEAYTWIQSISKNFIRGCLDGHPFIPLRGAITCGEFYVNEDKTVYFGNAFIEAYKAAESQDWIGLILTKEAEQRISEEWRLISAYHQFPVVDVPIKVSPSGEVVLKKHPAYSFHAEKLNQGKRIGILEEEMSRVDDRYKIKYRNTITHIKLIAQMAVCNK